MVIGFDAKRAFKNNTGLGNYSRMLICGLASAHPELNMVLYSPNISGYYKSFFTSFANISTRQPRGWRALLPSLWRSLGISRHLEEDGITLYHGLSHELPHLIPSDIKRVVTIHDLVAWRYPQYLGKADAWMHRVKIQHSCTIADLVIAISEHTKRDVMEFMNIPEEKIKVLYQSCDEIFWQPVDEQTCAEVRERYHLPQRYVICVGTIEERKNQMLLLDVVKHLPSDVNLIMVGRRHGTYGKHVSEAIGQRGLAARVRIIDDAEFNDFPALYACSAASVYVSHFEGFGLPILESMCCGTPAVVGNCSSMPEVGGDAVLYADADNADEVAAQLNRILSDASVRADLLSKAEVQKQKFTIDKIVDQFYQLYMSLSDDTQPASSAIY